MKRGKKAILFLGSAAVIVLLLLVNSFTGNPVSNTIAKKAVGSYIDANYSELNLRIQRCSYNFKFSSYMAFVQSDTSEDTAFSVYIDSFGNIEGDDYEYEVANNFTTFRRLDGEMREIANEMICNNLAFDFEFASFMFVKEGDLSRLERDMKLDIQNPPLPLAADVVLFHDDVSYETIAEVAKALEALLLEQNVAVSEYHIYVLPQSDKPEKKGRAVSWVNSLSVSYFPAGRMGEENLPEVMERFEMERVEWVNENSKK